VADKAAVVEADPVEVDKVAAVDKVVEADRDLETARDRDPDQETDGETARARIQTVHSNPPVRSPQATPRTCEQRTCEQVASSLNFGHIHG
jgi:hypothetical protein